MIIVKPSTNTSTVVSILPINNNITSVIIKDTQENKEYPVQFSLTTSDIYTALEVNFEFKNESNYILKCYDSNDMNLYTSNIYCTDEDFDIINKAKFNNVKSNFDERKTNNEFITIG